MALRLLFHHATVLLLLLPQATDATRARDMRLEMVTSSTPSAGGGLETTRTAPPSCASWRLAVETNNLRGWYSIPAACRAYVRDYMFGELSRQDCAVVASEAVAYADGLELAGDGKEADVDDTTLSNLPYYADTGFGAEPYNATYSDEYVANATAPPLPEVLELYERLLAMGIKVVFITGRHEYQREPTIKNLRNHTWQKLVLKYVP